MLLQEISDIECDANVTSPQDIGRIIRIAIFSYVLELRSNVLVWCPF